MRIRNWFPALVLLVGIGLFGLALSSPVLAQPAKTVDLDAYCAETGSVAVLTGTTVYDWYCQDTFGNLVPIDMDDVCTAQYWSGLTAFYVAENQPNSWHCSQWCLVTPQVGKFGWFTPKPVPALRLESGAPMVVNLAEGNDHMFLFKGQVVGSTIVTFAGFEYGITQWSLNQNWVRSNGDWKYAVNWKIKYRTGYGHCPYSPITIPG